MLLSIGSTADFAYWCEPDDNEKGQNFLSAFLAEKWQTQIGRDIVFSADLCYNDMGDENG